MASGDGRDQGRGPVGDQIPATPGLEGADEDSEEWVKEWLSMQGSSTSRKSAAVAATLVENGFTSKRTLALVQEQDLVDAGLSTGEARLAADQALYLRPRSIIRRLLGDNTL